MIREIVKIDRDLCNGCGECIPNCHEGALQIIDGKATLVSELMCDGLGACLGHCPLGAMTIEKREAEAYDERAVILEMIKQGKNVLIAHFKHLKEHNETEFLQEGIACLKENKDKLDFNIEDIMNELHKDKTEHKKEEKACGCPGSQPKVFNRDNQFSMDVEQPSELRQWPVQMHLVNPAAAYFKESDLLLAADCVAYTVGNFHSKFLKNKTLAIACPKLDSGMEAYIEKLTALIDNAKINTLTVMLMQVPCCGGLLQMAKVARQNAQRNIPIKAIIVGLEGNILSEDWI